MTSTEHEWFAGIGDRTGIDRVPEGILVKGPPLTRPLLLPFDAISSAMADVARDHPSNPDGVPRQLTLPAPEGVEHAITFTLSPPVHTPGFERHGARASGVRRGERRHGMDVDLVTVPVTHLAESIDLVRRAGIRITADQPLTAPEIGPQPAFVPRTPPPAAEPTRLEHIADPSLADPALAYPALADPALAHPPRGHPLPPRPPRDLRLPVAVALVAALLVGGVVALKHIAPRATCEPAAACSAAHPERRNLAPAVSLGGVDGEEPTGFDLDELRADPALQATRDPNLETRAQDLDRARHPDGGYLEGTGLVKAGELTDKARTKVVSLELFATVAQAQEFLGNATTRLYRDHPPANRLYFQTKGAVVGETSWHAADEPGDPHFVTFLRGRLRVLIIYSGTEADQGVRADDAAKAVDAYLRSQSPDLQPAPPVSGPLSTVVPPPTVPGGVSLDGRPFVDPTGFNTLDLMRRSDLAAALPPAIDYASGKVELRIQNLDPLHPDSPYLSDVGLVTAQEIVTPNREKVVSLELFDTRQHAAAFHTAATAQMYNSYQGPHTATLLPTPVLGATMWDNDQMAGDPTFVTFLRGRVRVVIIFSGTEADQAAKATEAANAVDAYLRTQT